MYLLGCLNEKSILLNKNETDSESNPISHGDRDTVAYRCSDDSMCIQLFDKYMCCCKDKIKILKTPCTSTNEVTTDVKHLSNKSNSNSIVNSGMYNNHVEHIDRTGNTTTTNNANNTNNGDNGEVDVYEDIYMRKTAVGDRLGMGLGLGDCGISGGYSNTVMDYYNEQFYRGDSLNKSNSGSITGSGAGFGTDLAGNSSNNHNNGDDMYDYGYDIETDRETGIIALRTTLAHESTSISINGDNNSNSSNNVHNPMTQ